MFIICCFTSAWDYMALTYWTSPWAPARRRTGQDWPRTGWSRASYWCEPTSLGSGTTSEPAGTPPPLPPPPSWQWCWGGLLEWAWPRWVGGAGRRTPLEGRLPWWDGESVNNKPMTSLSRVRPQQTGKKPVCFPRHN